MWNVTTFLLFQVCMEWEHYRANKVEAPMAAKVNSEKSSSESNLSATIYTMEAVGNLILLIIPGLGSTFVHRIIFPFDPWPVGQHVFTQNNYAIRLVYNYERRIHDQNANHSLIVTLICFGPRFTRILTSTTLLLLGLGKLQFGSAKVVSKLAGSFLDVHGTARNPGESGFWMKKTALSISKRRMQLVSA